MLAQAKPASLGIMTFIGELQGRLEFYLLLQFEGFHPNRILNCKSETQLLEAPQYEMKLKVNRLSFNAKLCLNGSFMKDKSSSCSFYNGLTLVQNTKELCRICTLIKYPLYMILEYHSLL